MFDFCYLISMSALTGGLKKIENYAVTVTTILLKCLGWTLKAKITTTNSIYILCNKYI